MDKDSIIVLGSLITILSGVYFTNKKSKVENKAVTITGEVALSDGWEKYATKLEQRLSAVEKAKDDQATVIENLKESFNKLGHDYLDLQTEQVLLKAELQNVKIENKRLTLENETKIGRITILEGQIIDLQSQLDHYSHIDIEKVDAAKESLHRKVEEKLEDLKN